MLLMRKRKRHALKALYYFYRAVDDAVDEAPNKAAAKQALAEWRGEIENLYVTQQPPNSEIIRQLGIAVWQYKLPRQPFEDFFQGMELDCAETVQIKTEEGLERYCYCVAGAVGLQAMRIFGCKGKVADDFAVTLGQALQLTNILRDTKVDALDNRVYIPTRWGEEGLSKLILKAEDGFEEVAMLQKKLPSRNIMPALLMRDIYYWKFEQIIQKLPHKKLPASMMVKLSFKALRCMFG